MRLFSLLLRALILVAGAVVGLGLFLLAVVVFLAVVLGSLLRGRRPNVAFRVNRSPRARRSAPAGGDVVDVEAREVVDAAPLPPPRA